MSGHIIAQSKMNSKVFTGQTVILTPNNSERSVKTSMKSSSVHWTGDMKSKSRADLSSVDRRSVVSRVRRSSSELTDERRTPSATPESKCVVVRMYKCCVVTKQNKCCVRSNLAVQKCCVIGIWSKCCARDYNTVQMLCDWNAVQLLCYCCLALMFCTLLTVVQMLCEH